MTTLFVLVLAGAVALVGAALISKALAVLAQVWWLLRRALPVAPYLLVVAWVGGVPLPWWLTLVGWLGTAYLIYRRWGRTSTLVARWGNRARRKGGVASALDVARTASTVALRCRAATVRPSFARYSRLERMWEDTAQCAVLLVRAGVLRVWASIEDVTLVFGGPRTGKTGWLAARVLDAPGAVLVTSTRTDLHDITAELRRRRGPVFVFNAVGLGGARMRSTITFDPLIGCADPVVAFERATDLLDVGDNGGGDHVHWVDQARRVLTALLHAAALGDRHMRDVLAWVAQPDEHRGVVVRLLRKSCEPAFVPDAEQFVTTNDRTRSSITSTIMPALGWLTNPSAAAAAQPCGDFDVQDLLLQRATIYLLGAPDTPSAPLIAALTGHIAREARRLAAHKPGGRLDPNLTLCLDEAALMSPPLDDWTADMGGRGVTILACFQSRAQLLARWGDHITAEILNNTGSIMLFGGTRDKADLGFWSALAGERDEVVTTLDERGQVRTRSARKAPVIAPAQIAHLPKFRVIVFRKGIPVLVGKARMVWRRRDVRAFQGRTVRARVAALAHWWADRRRTRAAVQVAAPIPLNVVPPLATEGDSDAQAS